MYEALASLDQPINYSGTYSDISIHETLASLDGAIMFVLFNKPKISIHEALASLDHLEDNLVKLQKISIHEALTSLDFCLTVIKQCSGNFNPRGSYKPRLFFLD